MKCDVTLWILLRKTCELLSFHLIRANILLKKNLNYFYILSKSKYLILKCIKLYLTKFSEKESLRIKLFFINIHLNIGLFTFNKYCIYKLLYMKCYTLCTSCFLGFLYGFVDVFAYTQNTSKVKWCLLCSLEFNLIIRCNSLFCDFQDFQI